MPRLIVLAPCENVIVSQDNKLSLISLLETINVGIPANQPIPPNSSIPMPWFAVTVWEREASDGNTEFESFVQAGHLQSTTANFRMTTPMHRIIGQILGFPLVFGEVRLKAFIRAVGTQQWNEKGTYPLIVQRFPDGPLH